MRVGKTPRGRNHETTENKAMKTRAASRQGRPGTSSATVTGVRRVPRAAVTALFCAAIHANAEGAALAKTASTFYPASVRANATRNAARYEWARKQVEEAVAAAKPWAEMSDDDLWRMIVPPKLKRAIMVNVNKGCPHCGMAMYGPQGPRPYAWIAWVEGHPWKVQCPGCKELFPKNDFGAFYRSAIDPTTGLFDPVRGDRRLLVNADHPDPNDPLHQHAVDDGGGWQRFPGGPAERDWYIGYHVHFGMAGRMTAAMRSLATAYALTGKPLYAHKCAILLDRYADVAPEYDGAKEQFFNNVWRRYSDGVIGPSYWAGEFWAQRAIDYDMIYDGIGTMPETQAFLAEKARRYKVPMPKANATDIRQNIEQRGIVEVGRHRERIWMNGTITEMCQAKVDLVLRGDEALRDFASRHMPAIVPPQHLNDDGSGNERSTGYDAGAFAAYCRLLEDLAAMDRKVAKAVLDGYPRLRAAFDFWPDIWCLERFIPQIGDVGEPGATRGPVGTAGAYLALFDITTQPRYAQVAVRIAGQDVSRLPRNIYANDPEGLVERALAADRAAGPWTTPSLVKRDYGLAILRAGDGPGGAAATLYYSPRGGTSSHSHFDALTLGLYAGGLSMICEHGYPLYTGDWPARGRWTSHTRSHATVVVNGQCQQFCDEGRLLGFAEHGTWRFVSAEAPCAGAKAGVTRYRRTVTLVEAAPGTIFVVDVFRVRGGRVHDYTIPLFYGDLKHEGLAPAPHADLCDGYITNVRSAPASMPWTVDAALLSKWEGEVAAHLRIHGSASDADVLLGRGESRWGREDPRRLPYVLVRRQGETTPLDSTFVIVYEPYRERPFLSPHPLTAAVQGDSVGANVRLAGEQGAFEVNIRDGDADRVTVECRRIGD